MSRESTEVSWNRFDVSGSTNRRLVTDASGTLSNLSIKKRAERRRQKQRADLVRQHMESMNRAPTLLQTLIARLIK